MPNVNIVAHNLPAMFSNRQLGITNNSKAKSSEKLSSGYKINRAADDAAGLSISEKMRKMIRGLDQGSKNIQDGISLIHVADGAMEEMTSCLDRIYELSVKAYNGTNSRSDREDMQSEINNLLDEIERIADTTKFNELHVLQQKPFHYVETVESLERDIPEWLKVSDEISFDNSSALENGSKVQLEDKDDNPYYNYLTNGYNFPYAMKRTGIGEEDGDTPENNKKADNDTYDFWGSPQAFKKVMKDDYKVELNNLPDPGYVSETNSGKIKYVGPFSDDLKNNASAEIDFSGLKQAKSGEDLYNKLLDLLGTSVGVPCMTHGKNNYSNIYGLNFVGERYEYASDSSYIKGNRSSDFVDLATIDLGNVTVGGKNIFDYAKSASSKDIASVSDDIAKALCAYSAKAISDECIAGKHFNMAYPDSAYKLVVYDVRDEEFFGDADSSGYSNTQVSKDRNAERHFLIKSYDPPFGDFETFNEGIWIQCSSENPDGLTIDLPYITNERLGIEGYTIAHYDTKSTINEEKTRKAREQANAKYKAEMEEYDRQMEEYKKKKAQYDKELQEWQKEKQEWDNDELHIHTSSKTIEEHTIDVEKTRTFINKYGEEEQEKYIEQKVVPKETFTTVEIDEFTKPKPIAPVEPTKPVDTTGITIYDYTDIYAPDDFEIISRAKKTVTSIRAHLGAQENRLEHTYRNNQNKAENTQAAESLIRDTDMAKEMVNFSKLSILQQAGQSMLAQSQQSNQGILSLLG